VHHRVRRIVWRRAVLRIVTGTRLTATTASATTAPGIGRTVVAFTGVAVFSIGTLSFVGFARIGAGGIPPFGITVTVTASIVTTWATVVRSTLLTSPATAAATATAPPPVGWAFSLIFVVVKVVELVRVRGVVVVVSLDRLWRDEKRHVLGTVDRDRPLKHRLGFRFNPLSGHAGFSDHARFGHIRRRGNSRRGSQQVAHAHRIGAVDAGMRAADPPVKLAQRVENPPTSGPERSRQ
jgi:hypothetical protein